MPKTASRNKVKKPASEPQPFEIRDIDLTTFKPDISPKDWTEMFNPANLPITPVFFLPIETLSSKKTVGSGRTNLTLIMATLVQTDTNVPYASFDRQQTPSRNPAVSVHFEPSAYGITTPGTYFMAFSIDVAGRSTFEVNGFAGAGTLSGAGQKVLSGQQVVTLIFRNLPPSQQVWGSITQTAGAQWTWYTTRISFPPLVIGT